MRRLETTDEPRLEMTPMIDVTFLLLIFFMCTLKFESLEGKLAAFLPKNEGLSPTSPEQIEAIELQLWVIEAGRKVAPDGGTWQPGAGRFVFDGTRRLGYRVGPLLVSDLKQVSERLRQLHRADPQRPLEIDARPGVVHEEAVCTLDLALEVGIDEVRFVSVGN